MEYVRFKINILQILVVAKRLYLKKIKEALYIDIKRKYKEEMEGVYDNGSALVYLIIKTNS